MYYAKSTDQDMPGPPLSKRSSNSQELPQLLIRPSRHGRARAEPQNGYPRPQKVEILLTHMCVRYPDKYDAWEHAREGSSQS